MTNLVAVSAERPAYFAILHVLNDAPLFTKAGYFRHVKEELNHFVEFEGMEVLGYVIMPEYVQLLFQSAKTDAEALLKHFAIRTSGRLLDYIENNDDPRRKWLRSFFREDNRNGNEANSVWGEIHFEMTESERIAASMLHDMHHLPVREGITTSPEGYVYSGASGGKLRKHNEIPVNAGR